MKSTAPFWPIALLTLAPLVAQAQTGELDALSSTPTLRAQAAEQIQAAALAWLQSKNVEASVVTKADELWKSLPADATGAERLDLLTETLALADERVAALRKQCMLPRPRGPLAPQEWLKATDLDPLVVHNMRLTYGRWLTQEGLFDEGLEQLQGLEPAQVVDPATLYFYRAVCHHRLLNKVDGLEAIARLAQDVADSPQRYVAVSGLMEADLKELEDESLDHIARRMDDIRRRLELGRAGKKVRKIEDDVIASLDKLIEDMENQQQQQSGGGGAGGSTQPTAPMQDSRLGRASGAGDVNRKDVGHSSGWGDLPAKQREEAMQQIGKDFPAHYRDVIEQYFRKLASEDTSP